MEVIFQRPTGGFPELLRGSTRATDFLFLFYGGEETLECDNPSSVAHGCGFSNYIVVLKNISFFRRANVYIHKCGQLN